MVEQREERALHERHGCRREGKIGANDHVPVQRRQRQHAESAARVRVELAPDAEEATNGAGDLSIVRAFHQRRARERPQRRQKALHAEIGVQRERIEKHTAKHKQKKKQNKSQKNSEKHVFLSATGAEGNNTSKRKLITVLRARVASV